MMDGGMRRGQRLTVDGSKVSSELDWTGGVHQHVVTRAKGQGTKLGKGRESKGKPSSGPVTVIGGEGAMVM